MVALLLEPLLVEPLLRSGREGAAGAFVALWILLWTFACCLSIPLFALWIWSIVDCAKNESEQGNTKVVWILVIVLAGWIGTLIYLFARRPSRKRELGR